MGASPPVSRSTRPASSPTAPPSSSSRLHAPAMVPPRSAATLFVMTHDSIGVGEDGPAHQPIEHLASFRAMPGMLMMRPADGNETAGAYKIAVEQTDRPTTGCPGLSPTSRAPPRRVSPRVRTAPPPRRPARTSTASSSAPAPSLLAVEAARSSAPRRAPSPCSAELFEEQSDEYKGPSPQVARRSPPSKGSPSAGPSTRTSPSAATTSRLRARRHPVQGVRHHLRGRRRRRQVLM